MREHHVLGHGWRTGRPRLELRDLGNRRLQRLELAGRLRFVVTDRRRCLGAVRDGVRLACPDDALPGPGGLCEACARADGFRACMTCDGFRCPMLLPEIEAHCRDTHVLYLAAFGAERLKVGTAVWARRDARPAEQGPVAAIRIATGPGPLVRQAETLIARDDAFVDLMRREDKRTLLAVRTSVASARDALEAGAARARAVLPSGWHHLLHDPVVVPLPELAVRTRRELRHVDALGIGPGVLVEGQVVGAIGHLVVLQEPAGRFLLDLGELKTRIVDLDPRGSHRRATVQLSLFG